jgi:hypothetical protein
MVMIKRHFVCVGLLFNIISLYSMQENLPLTIAVQQVCRRVDEKYFGYIPKNCCGKSIIMPVASLYESSFVPTEKVTRRMNKIRSFAVSGVDKDTVLEKVIAEHWYVYRLMNILVKKECASFEGVKGSTIDEFHKPTDFQGLDKMVHERAYRAFFDCSVAHYYPCSISELGHAYSLSTVVANNDCAVPSDSQKALYLCQKALDNSWYEVAELNSLSQSDTVKELEESQKIKFDKMLNDQIELLSGGKK